MSTPRPLPAGIRLGLDFGPLLVFFIANWAAPVAAHQKVFVATGAFMAATALAMIISRVMGGGISKMLLFSGVMVLAFGGLTLWLQDDTFIKMKPTIYYLMVAGILLFGLWSGRPTLQVVLDSALPGLTARGWSLLSRNWALFFLVMAVANEMVWRSTSTSFWIGYKLWGAMPATFIFALANMPMLMRHGMNPDAAKDEAEHTPPVG
ncbi:septation protein A [Sphingomonas quercus]|uniref:Inner membrane-spanning protein YciB n=1 Tax=Sphingomonas quercus TaxID=2842451 RepID=A0ABS6BJ83_9SPHN|nr:septation protein A [Sphingomonas quercus]MBU3078375.1 septation protein A [Sphingomonas quercus]